MFTVVAFLILIGCTFAQFDDNGFYLGCYTKSHNFAEKQQFAGSADKCVDGCNDDYFRYAIFEILSTCKFVLDHVSVTDMQFYRTIQSAAVLIR